MSILRKFCVSNAPSLHLCQNRSNAPCHTTSYYVLQPPYSPDLTPYDFWLFIKLKMPIRGLGFDKIEEGPEGYTEKDHSYCFEDWKKRLQKCILSDVDYFELDEIDLNK